MSDAIALLQVEHRHMAKVLDVVAQQLHNGEVGVPIDYHLLHSAFDYCRRYPDQCHHPKEDLVYRKLLQRNPTAAENLKNLLEEHEALAEETQRCALLVQERIESPDARPEEFQDAVQHFVGFYRHHMATEEQHFFPMAVQTLSHNDWAEIDFSLFDQADPLLDTGTEKQFEQLRDEILRLSEAQSRPGTEQTEAEWLRRIESIAQFNDAMSGSVKGLQLVRLDDGAFGLQHGEALLVRIPACSETRAAWCAYYFWKGHSTRLNLPSPRSIP